MLSIAAEEWALWNIFIFVPIQYVWNYSQSKSQKTTTAKQKPRMPSVLHGAILSYEKNIKSKRQLWANLEISVNCLLTILSAEAKGQAEGTWECSHSNIHSQT